MTDRPRHLEPVPDEPTGPPANPEAERACLGGMLQYPTAIEDALNSVTAHEFYWPRHELIYHAIEYLYSSGEPVNTITVTERLGKDITRAGGQAYIEQLNLDGIHAVDPAYYGQMVAEKASARRLTEAGTRIVQLGYSVGGGDVHDLYQAAALEVQAAARSLPAGADTTAASSWAPVELADIIDNGEDLEHPTQLTRNDGQNLLYTAAIHSISGEPESGKTWVALIAATQALRNGEHVTYVDFEDRAGRVIPRLIHLGAPRQAILEHFHYIRPTNALDPAGRKHLDEHAAVSTLAILDGVTEAMTMHGLSLLDNEDAAKYLDLLPRHLADHGPAVLQIDHVVKDAEKQGRWAIGAGHKLAGLDGAAYGIKVLEPFGRGKLGRAAIAVHKDRPGAVREIALGNAVAHLVIDSRGDTMSAWLEEPTTMPKRADGGLRPTHLMEKVSRYVEMSPGASRKQIEDGVSGKREYVRMAIDALVHEEYLTVTAGPRGTQNHSLMATYREDEDHAN